MFFVVTLGESFCKGQILWKDIKIQEQEKGTKQKEHALMQRVSARER